MARRQEKIRRQSSPALSEEEQASLIRESQYQKGGIQAIGTGMGKKRSKTLEKGVRATFDIEGDSRRPNEKNARQLTKYCRTVPHTGNARGEIKDLYTIFWAN